MNTKTRIALRKQRIGDTWAQVAGAGDPLIIVHGGPGLDHSYLVEWLAPLAASRQLVFYDQRGCGMDNTPLDGITAETLVDQLVNVINTCNSAKNAAVFTHSWGAYLLYRAVSSAMHHPIHKAILLSPVGLTRKRFDESGERLMSRIPPVVLAQIEELDKAQDGLGVMRAALPYYVAKADTPPPVAFGFYGQTVYAKVLESLGDYDVTGISDSLPRSTHLIYGDADIELPDATREIHGRTAFTLLEGVGHFAFAEQPDKFLAAVQGCLNA